MDESDAVSIRKTKVVLNNPQIDLDLAFIKAHLPNLVAVMKSLETRGLPLTDSTDKLLNIVHDIKNLPGDCGKNYH